MRGSFGLKTVFVTAILLVAPMAALAGTWYQDADGDGWGDPGAPLIANSPPIGYVDNRWDCDDQDPAVRPGQPDICGSGIDRNCDSYLDSGCTVWFPDADGDGWGSNGNAYYGASPPAGYLAWAGDCHDQNPAIHPGAPEICGDLTDNNCDGPWDNTCSPVAVDGASWGAVKGTYR